MKCDKIKLRISEYIDNLLNEEEIILFQEHLQECEECNIYYQNFKLMIESLNEIDLVEPPINFNEQLHQRLVKEKSNGFGVILKYKKQALAVAALFLVAIISVPTIGNLSGAKLSGLKSENMAAEDRGSYGEPRDIGIANLDEGAKRSIANTSGSITSGVQSLEKDDFGMASTEDTLQAERKIIKRGRMSLEVKEFDKIYDQIISDVESKNGYIQSSEIYYHFVNKERPEESLKSAYMVIRIPSHLFQETYDKIKGLGTPIEEGITGEDITDAYLDTENQLFNLRIQEERLRDVLRKADKVEDILRIENELNRVRSEINRLDSTLVAYDKLVALSTLNLFLRQTTPDNIQIQSVSTGIWSKAINSFKSTVNKLISFFETMFVGAFSLLPIAMILSIIVVPAWIYFKKRRNTNM